MSLELTENKSYIGSGVLNDPVFILSCRVIGRWLPTRRRSVRERSATDWRSVGDWLSTVSCAFVYDCRKSATFWRSVGNRSTTGRRSVGEWKLGRDCLQPLQLVGDRSPTSWRPVGNLSATTKNLSTIDLVPERFHLQQPKPPCDQIVPATFCNQSPTCLQPPCNLPATTRNFGRKEVADRLQAMCDRGLTKFMGPTWGPTKPYRPQMGPVLAPWTLLSGYVSGHVTTIRCRCSAYH